jgi:hypothetical protein
MFFRPSTASSSQTRMSTTDLRSGGISAPTGFVHVSGYSRANYGRCSSISEGARDDATTPTTTTTTLRDHNNRSRARELANIDPKFTSQVGPPNNAIILTNINISHKTISSLYF